MARAFPENVPPAPTGAQTTKTYAIEVITPLFGGGVETRAADPVTVVRGMSVRGQLRFWWRATRGRQYETSRELWEKESEIWGNTVKASAVRVEVEITNEGRKLERETSQCPAYALFPFKGPERREARAGVQFKLHVSYPEGLAEEMAVAVRAWTNFGGIGSRTRRGCGALYCKETAPTNAAAVEEWWAAMEAVSGPCNKRPRPWPVYRQVQLSSSQGGADAGTMAAWNLCLSTLQEFRQGEDFARNRGRTRRMRGKDGWITAYVPGRSRWPEADSLRAKTRRGESSHMGSNSIPTPGEEPAFPRAALGLPIVFQFQSSEAEANQPEADDRINEGSLLPLDHERMASPLILRPWRFQDGTSRGILLLLQTQGPTALRYDFKRFPRRDARQSWEIPNGRSSISRPTLREYPNSPLANPLPVGDALYSVMTYFSAKGFRTILKAVQK